MKANKVTLQSNHRNIIFMRGMIKQIPKMWILCTILLLTIVQQAKATHNRAGEITFEQIGDLRFRVTITTYTKQSSTQADRDSLELFWGDGSFENLGRSNGPNNQGESLGNDIKKNIYIGEHTYGGMGTYKLTMNDPNRNAGILNVNFPLSDQVPFQLETELKILDAFFSGYNTSPILTNPPIDEGCTNQVFKHNAGAVDAEGDSLAYEFIIPLQAPGVNVSNYVFPHLVGGGPASGATLKIDPLTGTITWQNPVQAGEYNLAFIIKEYRNRTLISTTIRDMQITIETCNNRPPVIEPIEDICVIAGDTVHFDVKASDPDAGQKVTLTALGDPILNSSATFVTPAPNNPITGVFDWKTACEDIQDQYYSVLFRAEDDFTLGGTPQFLVDYKTVRIRVVGPPPQDVQADVTNGEVDVTWESPYSCENSNNFRGFSVWRKEGSNPFVIDTCTPGLDGKGYTQIASKIKTLQNGRYFHKDTNVERGRFYCYRILADFAEFTPSGQPFNLSESLPSEEVCVQMSQDLPLITNVSIEVTDFSNGEIYVRWSKPSPVDLDTVQNPGPYEYRLFRSDDLTGGNLQQVFTATANQFWQANDTIFTDTGLNTNGSPYSYLIEFYSNGILLGETSVASQIFLTILSTDQKNILAWTENVPWDNSDYVIYKRNNNTGIFDSIAITQNMVYEDLELINGVEYCYYVKGIGSYNIPRIVDPLINLSQRACGVPIDTVPPCPPVLTVTNKCNDDNFAGGDFENDLTWTNPNNSCANDTRQYNVYYAETSSAPFSIIETLDGENNTAMTHFLNNSIAGCYFVTAIDSVGNESRPSNIICVDNCPDYSLPNVFTPNGDGANEVYKPFPYRYISRIDLKIFNRQGNLVHQTSDPDINWNGKNLNGQDLAEGVYFYQCTVFEIRVDGEAQRPDILSGFIHIIRGK